MIWVLIHPILIFHRNYLQSLQGEHGNKNAAGPPWLALSHLNDHEKSEAQKHQEADGRRRRSLGEEDPLSRAERGEPRRRETQRAATPARGRV